MYEAVPALLGRQARRHVERESLELNDPDDSDGNSAEQTKWSRLKINDVFWGSGQIQPHKTKIK